MEPTVQSGEVGPGVALSVVIASVNGLPMIEDCLAALAPRQGGGAHEVIVADSVGGETVRRVREEFPWVRVLAFSERQTIPQLRAAGLAASRGEVVAIIEDHCIAGPEWFGQMLEAHTSHPECVAIGGAVENGSRDRLVDWAVFFCEYSHAMLPISRGPARDITGNNASYKRRAFEGIDQDALTGGFWEFSLHGRLRARGDVFWQEPAILVYHKKRFGFGYFLSQRYHYSRYYTGSITAGAGIGRRVARGLMSLALPPLLLFRIAAQVVRKRRHLKEFALSSPILLVFTCAWAIGELVGCLAGPGRSLYAIE